MAFGYLSKNVKDVSVLVSSNVGGKDDGEVSNFFAYFWRIVRSNIVKVLRKVIVARPQYGRVRK